MSSLFKAFVPVNEGLGVMRSTVLVLSVLLLQQCTCSVLRGVAPQGVGSNARSRISPNAHGLTTVKVGDVFDTTPVAPNFVGLSIEVPDALKMIGETGENKPLSTLLGHMYKLTSGPHPGPTLRFGGNSADDSAYLNLTDDRPGTYPPGIKYSIGEKDLVAYTRFATATAAAQNVSVIIDTNFGTSPDPRKYALGHVKAVVNHPGLLPKVSGLEVGNEMDIYFHEKSTATPHRNESYTEAEYEEEFANFVDVYQKEGGLPDRMIQGCAYATDSGEWGDRFAGLVAHWKHTMRSVSLHKYPTSTCGGKIVTAESLLSDYATRDNVDKYRGHIKAAIEAGVDFVIGEGNSASCGGQKGVSDTMASTIWSLDFLPTLSKAGCRRMNFHGGPNGNYAAIRFLPPQGTLQTEPLYYGLYLFSELVANHSQWLTTSVSGAGLPPKPSPSADPLCKNGIFARGTSVCCAKECGQCGGDGCNDFPGGYLNCCAGSITKSNASCDTHTAPCLVDAATATSAIVSHATASATHTRVLVVRKSGGDGEMPVEICGTNFSVGAGATAKGDVLRLSGSAGLATTATNGEISLAGQTLSGSADGEWKGQRVPEEVGSRPGQSEGELCFDIKLGAYSAAVLAVAK